MRGGLVFDQRVSLVQSAGSKMSTDNNRSPLHCLGSVFAYGDSLRESYIFALLTDSKHWLDEVFS